MIRSWWVRELSFIDPRYKVAFNPQMNYYEVYLPVKRYIKGVGSFESDVNVAIFEQLNDAALNDLRYRKWKALKEELPSHPMKQLNWIKQQNMEAKQKAHQLSVDRITEGLMKAHRMATTQTFDMGGKG